MANMSTSKAMKSIFAHYEQIENLSILFHRNAKLREAIRLHVLVLLFVLEYCYPDLLKMVAVTL